MRGPAGAEAIPHPPRGGASPPWPPSSRGDALRLAEWLSDTAAETLGCYVLAREDVRQTLRSTNSVERHHEEARCRTRVIRIFPHAASLQRWLSARSFEREESAMRRNA